MAANKFIFVFAIFILCRIYSSLAQSSSDDIDENTGNHAQLKVFLMFYYEIRLRCFHNKLILSPVQIPLQQKHSQLVGINPGRNWGVMIEYLVLKE